MPPLAEMTLPSAGLPVKAVAVGVLPPMVFPWASLVISTPLPPLPRAAVPGCVRPDVVIHDLIAQRGGAFDQDAVAAVAADHVR